MVNNTDVKYSLQTCRCRKQLFLYLSSTVALATGRKAFYMISYIQYNGSKETKAFFQERKRFEAPLKSFSEHKLSIHATFINININFYD